MRTRQEPSGFWVESRYWIARRRVDRRHQVVLMVDTSLSMAGEKMALAVAAAAVLALKLRPGDLAVVLFADGSRKTLGVMLAGEYEFGTAAAERMEVLAGEMRVRLPGAAEFRTFRAGDAFDVPADSKFALVIPELADYCCSYY